MALFIPPAIETIEAVSGALLGAATVIYEASGHPSGHQTTITDHFPKSSKKHKSSVWEPKYTRTMPGVKRYNTGRRKNPAVFNLTSSTSMVSNDNNGDEVPVIPPPRHVAQVSPDYFTVKHTLYNYQRFLGTSNSIQRVSFKMNGLNNPVLSQTTPNIQQPMGTDIRQTDFNYYRVLKAFIKFTYISECPFTQIAGFEVNDSTTSYLSGDPPRAFSESKQTHHAIVPKTNENNKIPRTAVFTYEFDPNRNHHVTETGVEGRWTAKSSDPTSIHNIHFTACIANSGSTDWTTFHNEIITEIIYLTQWRESVTTIWGTPDTDI